MFSSPGRTRGIASGKAAGAYRAVLVWSIVLVVAAGALPTQIAIAGEGISAQADRIANAGEDGSDAAGRSIRYRLHWEGNCNTQTSGYMDLDPTVQLADEACAGFSTAFAPATSLLFTATDGLPFALDAKRVMVARLDLEGYYWLDARLRVETAVQIGREWFDVAASEKTVTTPTGSALLEIRLDPADVMHRRLLTGLRIVVSMPSGEAYGWIDLPDSEFAVPVFDDSAEASDAAPPNFRPSRRNEHWIYRAPGGPACGLLPGAHACVISDTFKSERFVSVKTTDASGLSVPGVIAYWTGTLWMVLETFCGRTNSPVEIFGGQPIMVAVYETAPWDASGCIAVATTGTVRAVFSASS